MWTKPYGKTGKNVTVVSFGGMRFLEPKNHDANADIVLHAFRKGINYFDTAPGYCGDNSEPIMGAAFKHMPRDKYYCATKCMDADGAKFRASLERSLQRLGVEQIDFMHIWCIVHPGQWKERIDGGAVAAAIKAKEEGLVGHVVASVHLSGQETCDLLDGEPALEGLTIGYNAVNFPFRGKALAGAAKHKVGVVTMNPLSGGLIPNNPERFDFLRAPGDRNVVEAAIRFNISHPAVTSALVGFSSKEQVDLAVAAAENFKGYPAAHIEKVKGQISRAFDGLCTMCGYCMADGCPNQVPITKYMESYNYKILDAEGRDAAITDRLKWHWWLPPEGAADCMGCGKCERLCTQHLPIRERLRHIAQLKKG
jgi:predicted aldo/keto reductase-like oxidoreductase